MPSLGHIFLKVYLTHSPHQVFHKNKQAIWNVAVSIDSSVILEPDEVIPIAKQAIKKKAKTLWLQLNIFSLDSSV